MNSFQYISPINEFEYFRPSVLEEALNLMSEYGNSCRVIAGGTDLTIALKNGEIPKAIIDISNLKQLKYIKEDNESVRIGSLTTFDEIFRSGIILKSAQCLSEAAYNVGTWQIRNLATIGGNIANASPAADSAPPLIVLDSMVKVESSNGRHEAGIMEMFTGPKRSSLKPGELITEIQFRKNLQSRSSWSRVGRRNANTISVVSVAVKALVEDNVFKEARIGLGAVGPTPIFAERASNYLVGRNVSLNSIEEAASIATKESSPISDVRGSREYRLIMVNLLVKRLLTKVVGI
ncbi:MAG: xanthine dehydrogenase family protein subunit M [Conexivisphaerales archaeon]